MEHRFPRTMEAKAAQLELEMEFNLGFKPFYSFAGLFNARASASKVFVGLAPGGRAKSKQLDEDCRHLERVYEDAAYNSYLCEAWECNGRELRVGQARLQKSVRKLFQRVYGSEQELIRTPCFNIVPFRVNVSKELNAEQRSKAFDWGGKVLNRLSPKLIICYSTSQLLRVFLRGRAAELDARLVMPTSNGAPFDQLFEELSGLRKMRPELFA